MSKESLTEAMKREADEFVERRRQARMLSNLAMTRSGGSTRKEQIEARVAARVAAKDSIEPAPMRDPCGFCGVRADRHKEFGCKRWRVAK